MKNHGAAALEAVWRALLESMEDALRHSIAPGLSLRELFSSEKPRLAVLTSLAAGADQIGAAAALKAATEHPAIVVELEALLPFAEDYYPGLPDAPRKEFRPQEAEQLRALAASARQVVRLPGDAGDEQAREQAYRQASLLLLQNSDILIALYDPARRGTGGGTAETIRHALTAEVPIVGVLTSEQEARIQVVRRPSADGETAPQWNDAAAVTGMRWRDLLADCVREQLVLPEAIAEEDDESGEAEKNLTHALFRLGLIAGTERLPALCRMQPAAVTFEAIWKVLQSVARAAAHRLKVERLRAATASRHHPVSVQPYAPFYERASRLAIEYMRAYRGAFVLSYWLAGAAVGAAVALMAASLLAGGHPPHVLIWLLGGAKIVILVVLFGLEWRGHRGRYQEAGADFRYVAELLRPMQWLAPLGTYPPAVDLPLHAARHDPRRKWMAWLVRAVARSSPCVAGSGMPRETVGLSTTDAAAALERASREWLQGQVAYHRQAAARMHVLEDGLERLNRGLLLIVLAAALGACVIELWDTLERIEDLHRTAVILSAVAALLPAWIAAFAGVAFQSEGKRLAATSDAMEHALEMQQQELRTAANRIAAGQVSGSSALSVANTLLRKASTMTIREAGDWKVLYQTHVIHAG